LVDVTRFKTRESIFAARTCDFTRITGDQSTPGACGDAQGDELKGHNSHQKSD